MRIKFLVLTLALLTHGFSYTQEDDDGIQFEKISFKEAVKKAKSSNKLIFLDAYAEYCAPCKWMDVHTFKNDKVAALFNQNFINIKVDMEKGEGPNIAKKFEVTSFPTLFFINKDGEIEKKVLGAKPAKELFEIGKNLLL